MSNRPKLAGRDLPETEPTRSGPSAGLLAAIGVGAVLLVAIVVLLVVGLGGDDGDDDPVVGAPAATGDAAEDTGAAGDAAEAMRTDVEVADAVSIGGQALPPAVRDATADPALGQQVPTVIAPRLGSGERLELASLGRPRAIGFLAHWCPHCQTEVSQYSDWLAAGNSFPDGADIQAVSIRQAPGEDNWPAQAWLAGEAWPFDTVVDDVDGTIEQAFGVGGTPQWVLVDADGKVAARINAVSPDDLSDLLTRLIAGETLIG